MLKRKRRTLMQRIIDNKRATITAEAELRDSYKDLYLAMGFTPEQVHNMVK